MPVSVKRLSTCTSRSIGSLGLSILLPLDKSRMLLYASSSEPMKSQSSETITFAASYLNRGLTGVAERLGRRAAMDVQINWFMRHTISLWEVFAR